MAKKKPSQFDICLYNCTSFGIRHEVDWTLGDNYATILFLKPTKEHNFHIFYNYHNKDRLFLNDIRKEYFRNETFVYYKSPKKTFIIFDDHLNNGKFIEMKKFEIESILSRQKAYQRFINKFYEDYSRNKKNELFYNGVVDKDYYFFL
jgi:hypothetical protein